MKCLIRMAGVREGVIEYDDTEYQVEVLTLGRGSQCDLILEGQGILPQHAEISLRLNGRAVIKAVDKAGVEVNGKFKRRATLKVNDQVSIAGQPVFSVIDAPHGFDLALSWNSPQRSNRKLAFVPEALSLREAGWSWKKWMWFSTVIVLTVGLLLPLGWVYLSANLHGIAPYWPLKDDIWSSGPLHKAHRLPELIDDCGACHKAAFEHVADSVCSGCHQTTGHFPEHAELQQFSEDRCSACHREHNEPAMLTRTDEALCVNCHSRIDNDTETMHSIRKVEAFESHPEFKLALLVATDSKQPLWETHRMGRDENTVEKSNLTFSHRVHLDKKGIDGPDGNLVMSCGDCHSEQQNGKRMQPVNMENHCSSCHSLGFEPSDPERQVVHGEPAKVLLDLEEYYSRLYALQGGPEVSELTPSQPARRPGKPNKAFYAAMKAWSDERAYETATELLEQSACHTCHDVTRFEDRAGAKRWQVPPVMLNNVWYPLANFDHASHRETDCVDCHAALVSETAHDVLIPDLKNCAGCHGGADSAQQVSSSCVSCHRYHGSYQGLYREVRHDKNT